MKCKFTETPEGTWTVTPLAGGLANKMIGLVDGFSIRAATFDGPVIQGDVEAIWGLTVVDPTLFDDPATVHGVVRSRNFRMSAETPAVFRNGSFVVGDRRKKVRCAQAAWAMNNIVRVSLPIFTSGVPA